GARIRLITDGDIAGAISVSTPGSGSDILFGVGGTPEGVTAACALLCTGGTIIGRLWPRNEDEKRAALDAGYDLDRILTTTDLVAGEEVFFAATGISDGDLLKGVHYRGDGASTESLVMRAKSGTIRTIHSEHRWQNRMRHSAVQSDCPSGPRPVPDAPRVAARRDHRDCDCVAGREPRSVDVSTGDR